MKNPSKFWTKMFGIKVGDFIRFKFGKVIWEVYHEGNFEWTSGRSIGTRHYWKLKRYRKSKWGRTSWHNTIYRTIWDFELNNLEIEKVGN